MRIILCGGGTAGHINPALAIADELKERDKNSVILFIGREGGRENEAVTKARIPLKTVKIQGLIRSFSSKNIDRIRTAIKARETAKKIITDFKPDVVLGTGGYVCWPVLSAARGLNIPVALHESNVIPGLTTKLLARKCNIVFLNHEESAKYLPKRARYLTVGNPIRKGFSTFTREDARRKLGIGPDEFLILSFGGSGGAQKINDVIVEVIKNYSSKEKSVRHIHATGVANYSETIKKCNDLNSAKCEIKAYIDNMPLLLSAADLAICRSGAVTVSELCALGVCAILIPSPNVTNNHQFENARVLSEKDAAVLIEEKNLTAEGLINVIICIKNDKNGRKRRAKNIKALSTPNSAKLIINELKMLKNGSF